MFEIVSKYQPAGDQQKAIEELVKGIKEGKKEKGLLGQQEQERLSRLPML